MCLRGAALSVAAMIVMVLDATLGGACSDIFVFRHQVEVATVVAVAQQAAALRVQLGAVAARVPLEGPLPPLREEPLVP
jgi:hypothetical protein